MKLALGTVQFGLRYGVANVAGRTSADEVAGILDAAQQAGIDTLDTAAAYGDSEQVLGEIGAEGWTLVSKLPPLPQGVRDAAQWVRDQVEQSLKRLNVSGLDGLLLHRADDLLSTQGVALVAGMRAMQHEGLVRRIGYSIYAPQTLPDLLAVMRPDLVQAPLSVVDQRLLRSGWLARLAGEGVDVHVRSVFLQGLLLMARDKRPPYFDQWHALWQQWDALAGAQDGTHDKALRLCLGFVKALPGINRVVVGVDSRAHLMQLLTAWDAARPVEGDEVCCEDPQLVEPFRWKVA